MLKKPNLKGRKGGSRKNSKVQQHQGAATDINTMVNNLMRTGKTGHPGGESNLSPTFSDNSEQLTFAEKIDIVAQGKTAFAEMPSKVRNYFQNDLKKFSNFMSNPDNLEKARELGIVAPAPIITPKTKEPEKAQETTTEHVEETST